MCRIFLFVWVLLDALISTVAFPQATPNWNHRGVHKTNHRPPAGTTSRAWLRRKRDTDGAFVRHALEPKDELLEHTAGSQNRPSTDRRRFLASALVAGGALMELGVQAAEAVTFEGLSTTATTTTTAEATLPWKPDPVNKRFGVTVVDAEKVGYNVGFITYLARFLLNFDPNCQRWWFSTKIPSWCKTAGLLPCCWSLLLILWTVGGAAL